MVELRDFFFVNSQCSQIWVRKSAHRRVQRLGDLSFPIFLPLPSFTPLLFVSYRRKDTRYVRDILLFFSFLSIQNESPVSGNTQMLRDWLTQPVLSIRYTWRIEREIHRIPMYYLHEEVTKDEKITSPGKDIAVKSTRKLVPQDFLKSIFPESSHRIRLVEKRVSKRTRVHRSLQIEDTGKNYLEQQKIDQLRKNKMRRWHLRKAWSRIFLNLFSMQRCTDVIFLRVAKTSWFHKSIAQHSRRRFVVKIRKVVKKNRSPSEHKNIKV